jgi:hypothetical protein
LRPAHPYYPFIAHLTSVNATEGHIRPVVNEVVEIVAELTSGLRGSSLSSCANGCTQIDIVELIAITLKVLVIYPVADLLSYAHIYSLDYL